MKRILSLFLAAMLLTSTMLVVPVYGSDALPSESSAPTSATEAPKPTETTAPVPDPNPTTAPTEGSTDPTTAPTDPKPCTHVYGDWTADEAAHGRKCTLCGYAESNAHSWAPDIITVDPTCGEAGGKCKVCTVCAGVLVTELIQPTGKHTYDNTCDTSCNVCGATRTVEHTFGTGWKYSGKGHWHYCTVCGAAGEVKDHYPGPAATEEKDQICLTCGMIMMKKKEHTHKWGAQWSSDADSHWYTCTVCQEKDKLASHSYDDSCDTECNTCGYVRTAAHTYGPEWSQSESGHWETCTVCGQQTPVEAHAADSSGTSCAVCGYAMEAAGENHQHEFEEDVWSFDEGGHWNLCICGQKENAGTHVWDEGVKAGKDIVLYRCEVCGAERQEQVENGGFPWLLVAAGGAILVCLVGIVACIIVIRRNREEEE